MKRNLLLIILMLPVIAFSQSFKIKDLKKMTNMNLSEIETVLLENNYYVKSMENNNSITFVDYVQFDEQNQPTGRELKFAKPKVNIVIKEVTYITPDINEYSNLSKKSTGKKSLEIFNKIEDIDIYDENSVIEKNDNFVVTYVELNDQRALYQVMAKR